MLIGTLIPRTLIQIVSLTLALLWAHAGIAEFDLTPITDSYEWTINSLEEYLRIEKERSRILKKYCSIFQTEQNRMEADSKYLENPINMFTAIKRLTVDLNFTKSMTTRGIEFESVRSQIQDIKYLTIKELAEDTLDDSLSFPISTSDFFEIGRILYESQEVGATIEWFTQMLDKSHMIKDDDNIKKFEVIEYCQKLDSVINDPCTDCEKNILPWPNLDMFLKFERKEKNPVVKNSNNINSSQWETNEQLYSKLCRGDIKLSVKVSKRLSCYYSYGSAPFFRLARVKIEQLYYSPDILLFYDVISDDEALILKIYGMLMTRRNTVKRSSTEMIPKSTTALKALLDGRDCHTVATISRRLLHLSGLSPISEIMEVINYGVSTLYDTHYNCLFNQENSRETINGDSDATFQLYLSNVEQGGAIVFSHFELTVYPVKNSALFWANAGSVLECPVLRGSKWVAKKWFKSYLKSNDLK